MTTNVGTRAAFQDSSPPGLPSPYEGPHNLNAFDEGVASEEEGEDSEEEGEDSEDEWHEYYGLRTEPFAALPLDYLLSHLGGPVLLQSLPYGIGVRDMDDGYDLALRLVPNEPLTPVRSKEVGFVFYIATSWDDDFTGIPAQRDTINAMLSEINWRDKIKWYLVGVWADKWREDYNTAVRKCDT
ncbi:hypothetical protein IW262DRAFT_1418096 [Armillaria fumosa]|nr:hypothetical protein IW262DRAFT_1418096 [Armillaria fumosa]